MARLKSVASLALTAAATFGFLAATHAAAGVPSAAGTGGAVAPDGGRPSDGAIEGGSIRPGESAGLPHSVPGAGQDSDRPSERAVRLCNDLTGSLREQCLLKEQGASTGNTAAPDPTRGRTRGPSAPPPQNPR
jgi:hypothetical protein